MFCKNRIIYIACFVFLFFIEPPELLFSQTTGSGQTGNSQAQGNTIDASSIITSALSAPGYRVTAGDVYTLYFTAGNQAVQYVIPVDTTYRIRVANLGIVDASGKTFAQLKTQVESIVTNNYPLSGVQFALTSPAVFKVLIKGEVQSAVEVDAGALTRLSTIASGGNDTSPLTQFASLRDVTIKSQGGRERVYDLFKASRFGDLAEDPYLRPGDEITFKRVERSVNIEGSVERPGTYQLKSGENLKELIEYYAGGFTAGADENRMEIIRLVNSNSIAGNKISVNAENIAANFTLENRDVVTVPDIIRLEPIIYAEGAVGIPFEGENLLAAANRLTVRFYQGETYAELVRRNIAWFTAVSDTKNAYVIRGEERIALNLNPVLYDPEYHNDLIVEREDILVVPFRQYYVNVTGAVLIPGKYPYIPDRSWDYYIAMAGGLNPIQNSREKVDIVDVNGKVLKKTDIITPETVITARTNSFTFYFNQYAPMITTFLSIVTSSISLYYLMQQ